MTATAAPSLSPDLDALAGLREATAGRYLVERELGRGGMGIVLLARDLRLERPVALKLLPPALAAQPELRDRFLREARAAASLAHPNIVPIHAVEEHPAATYFVMGFVDGETLTDRVRRIGPLPAGDVVRVLQDVGWALSYAHARGIVHRDVKPDNILVERATGRALVTDFGIARVADSTMTMAGTSMGTPQFMSPEQATGEAVDGRSDLYSLGIVGFFALTATLPFDASSAQAILAMQVTQPAPPVASRRASAPRALAEAVDRCLRKDPADRFPGADAFAAAIGTVQGAGGTPVAPHLRSYMRIAEASFTQTFGLLVLFPALAMASREVLGVLGLMAVLVPAVTLLQLLNRVRDLVRDGYSRADLDAAYLADARARHEELDLLYAARQRDGSIVRGKRRALVMTVVGLLLFGAALAQKRVAPDLFTRETRRMLAMVGGGILGLSFALRAMADPRTERRMLLVSGPLVMRRLSGLLFTLATRISSRDERTSVATAAGPATDVARLYRALPRATRRVLGNVPAVADALERAADALGTRMTQLEGASSEARRTTSNPDLAGAGSAARSAMAALEDRRAALGAELEEAIRAADAARAERTAAVEGLRMAMLRLSSGLGSPEVTRREVDAARALIAKSG